MRLITLRAWALIALSAGLQIYMFPTAGPMPAWRSWLGWFALTPFLLALSLPAKDGTRLSVRNCFLLGYLCGFLWYFGNCFWIYQTMNRYGGLPAPISFGIVILFSLYLGLYHALFGLLFALVRKLCFGLTRSRLLRSRLIRSRLLRFKLIDFELSGTLAVCPLLWVTVELARGQITGFPWDLLGYTQVDNGFVTRIAPYAGVMGISLLLMLVNAAFVPALLTWKRPQIVLAGLTLLAAVGLQSQAASAARHAQAQPHFLAVLLQENLSVGSMGKEVPQESIQDELQSFMLASSSPKTLGQRLQAEDRTQIIVWPEAPSHLRSDDPFTREKIGALARTSGVPVIVGSLGVDMDAAVQRGYYLYDSATWFRSNGSYAGRYDKIHLVPWGEYVPFKQVFSFAQKLTEGVGNMDPGHERNIFRTDGHAYGVFICYESIFGDEVRRFAKNGAEVLVNISDDGWYGETGAPWQHLNMARMRAIENHRWVLRSTNTGVTTAIDPWGRIAEEAPRHVRAAFAFPFDYETEQTIYARFGDWLAWTCAAITLMLAGLALLPGFKRPDYELEPSKMEPC